MAKGEASVAELVSMIEKGALRLPEMRRRYVPRTTRVQDLLASLSPTRLLQPRIRFLEVE